MRKLWGAAFAADSAELVDRFGQSIESDLAFWREDVIGSIAHAKMLGTTGILSAADSALLVKGLEQILEEGPSRLPTDVEDIHTAVEVRLNEIVGAVAGRLHTARSRNDQVATDTRLYLRRRLTDSVLPEVRNLQFVLLTIAKKHQADIIPGYTHQQPAQPITLGFHLLAHFWAFQRHFIRVKQTIQFVNMSPLGSAALAGTSFQIDRFQTSAELGFAAPIPNALDATSDRSFVLDALHICALIMIDLSRISQELVLWSTREFGYARLADHLTTGSSIMPQKRNADMAELIRGRSGRALGNYTAFAATMKALPLGYNRDTQDDKPGLFESINLVQDSLRLVALMLEGTTYNLDKLALEAESGFSTATDLADFLASSGIPFRVAHEAVGKAVRACVSGVWEREAVLGVLGGYVSNDVAEAALDRLTAVESIRRRESYGAPGPKAMVAQLQEAQTALDSD